MFARHAVHVEMENHQNIFFFEGGKLIGKNARSRASRSFRSNSSGCATLAFLCIFYNIETTFLCVCVSRVLILLAIVLFWYEMLWIVGIS